MTSKMEYPWSKDKILVFENSTVYFRKMDYSLLKQVARICTFSRKKSKGKITNWGKITS